MNQLYKFYNRNASSIRSILIANCPWLEDESEGAASNSVDENVTKTNLNLPKTNYGTEQMDEARCAGNPVSHRNMSTIEDKSSEAGCSMDSTEFPYRQLDNISSRSIHYSDEYRREYEDSTCCESSDDWIEDDDDQEIDDIDDDTSDDDLENLCPKYLIFSTGSKTYTPHQIGFKRVKQINFPKKLEPGPSLRERIATRDRERQQQSNEPRADPDWLNYDSVSDRFDKVDKLIDLHGHIIGMGLSPDHRYLYVNSRPWPQDYIISQALEPPPIAQEIDIHVIDLSTLKKVGTMLRAHKAYTPNTECFFIFLDVCDNYVAR